jgi:hypothetical protein
VATSPENPLMRVVISQLGVMMLLGRGFDGVILLAGCELE